MPISRNVSDKLEKSSWIRKMFEEGLRMKQEYGVNNVFDLSLGNPVVEPPEQVCQAIVSAANDTSPGLHRYMPNAGLNDVRNAIARSISVESNVKLTADHIVMVCGAAGGLNITLKTLLDMDEEVVVFSPYFVEYLFYSENHGGKTSSYPRKMILALTWMRFAMHFHQKLKPSSLILPITQRAWFTLGRHLKS